jgi:hypothetical protein
MRVIIEEQGQRKKTMLIFFLSKRFHPGKGSPMFLPCGNERNKGYAMDESRGRAVLGSESLVWFGRHWDGRQRSEGSARIHGIRSTLVRIRLYSVEMNY